MSPLYHDKFKEKKDKLVPGPGQYEFENRALKTAPNWGFGTASQRGNTVNGTKGINTEIKYNPDPNRNKSKSPQFRFGSDARKMYEDKQRFPGAGTYNIKSAGFADREKSKFHMGAKLQDQSKLNVPGAGNYNPEQTLTKKAASSFSMGLKLKGSLEQTTINVPGPGSYTNEGQKLKQAAPKFGFGTSKRPDITGPKKLQTPGPGEYKLPAKISNVSDFALPGRNPESKYV